MKFSFWKRHVLKCQMGWKHNNKFFNKAYILHSNHHYRYAISYDTFKIHLSFRSNLYIVFNPFRFLHLIPSKRIMLFYRLIMYYYKSYSMYIYNINMRYICQNFDTYVASFQQMSVVTLYLCTHIMCLLKGLKWCQGIRDETHEIIINFITLSILLQTCKYE